VKKKRGPESDRERFIRIAEKRTQRVIARLRILGNCHNRQYYEYRPKDVERIFLAISEAVAETRRLFDQKQSVEQFSFAEKDEQ
jgi:hypothetical protein